jgi:hypothetical protein
MCWGCAACCTAAHVYVSACAVRGARFGEILSCAEGLTEDDLKKAIKKSRVMYGHREADLVRGVPRRAIHTRHMATHLWPSSLPPPARTQAAQLDPWTLTAQRSPLPPTTAAARPIACAQPYPGRAQTAP